LVALVPTVAHKTAATVSITTKVYWAEVCQPFVTIDDFLSMYLLLA
jgi:hypothetical protein